MTPRSVVADSTMPPRNLTTHGLMRRSSEQLLGSSIEYEVTHDRGSGETRQSAALIEPQTRAHLPRRTATLPRVEGLESRSLMAVTVAANLAVTQAQLPNETLDQAVDLGNLSSGNEILDHGSLGDGPAGAADVQWYSFTLDQPARVTSELKADQQSASFQGVLSLFNNDPWDFGDPFDVDGHRLLDQVDGKSSGGVATLDQLLGPGTYYLAVSGSGNQGFPSASGGEWSSRKHGRFRSQDRRGRRWPRGNDVVPGS